ncbi:MAG: hypothetical protein IJ305_05200 [Oscillospiraceae bacterium]|nr:hypothetical protein [Oscillospiraceae bacterium]
MLKKLKRVNRGVLLAVIVLAIFAVYINIADDKFKEEEAEKVKDTVIGFCNELAEANGIMTKLDGTNDEEIVQELQDALSKVIEERMIQSDYIDNQNINSFSWYETKQTFIESLKEFDELDSQNVLTEISADVKRVSVKQNGSIGATCTADIEYAIKGKGDIGLLFPVYFYTVSDVSSGIICEMKDVEFQLVKEDGQWKICGISGYLWFN